MKKRAVYFANLLFCVTAIHFLFTSCQKEHIPPPKSHVLNISSDQEPLTLDPRNAEKVADLTLIELLYEGLTKIDASGKVVPALADRIAISPDRKIYTFVLKNSGWSNGRNVTAEDFEESWKSRLSPHLNYPHTDLFYAIKGAKEAKEGRLPLDSVAIRAVDNHTLVVELKSLEPNFLSLVALPAFYPLSREFLRAEKSAANMNLKNLLSNGPFQLLNWESHQSLVFVTNPYYWDAPKVRLNKVSLLILDQQNAFERFQKGEIDWIGYPFVDLSNETSNGEHSMLVDVLYINKKNSVLNDLQLIEKLNLILNREKMRLDLQNFIDQSAVAFYSPVADPHPESYYDENELKAKRLIQEYLKEHQISPDSRLTICYHGERNAKIARIIQNQWKKELGIEIEIQECPKHELNKRIEKSNYEVALAEFDLNARNKEDLLFQLSQQNPSDEKVMKPLLYRSYKFLKQPSTKDFYFSSRGVLYLQDADNEK